MVAKAGKPWARLVPLETQGERVPGRYYDGPGTAFFAPLPDDELKAWEIATKYRIGKYPNGGSVIADWETRLLKDGFKELPIGFSHALKAGTLPG